MSESPVRMQFPAASGYLVLARTAAASMCARLDYPLDRLEDVKLAVDEACTLLLRDAIADTTIELILKPNTDTGTIKISASTTTKHGRPPKKTSFAWTVLSALVDSVESSASNGFVTIVLHSTRYSNSVHS